MRPRVGISQCLLGDPVRHDGGHKRDETLTALGEFVEWVPVCPEMEVGMGAPREAIHLVDAPDGVPSADRVVRLMGIGSRTDWTARMDAFARGRVKALTDLDICGFVLKARSPSCGPRGVLVTGHDEAASDGRGLFAQALAEMLPGLPLEDEERLADPWIRAEFLDQVKRRALCFLKPQRAEHGEPESETPG